MWSDKRRYGLMQKEIVSEMKINKNTYSQYESGKRQISVTQIPILAMILNSSIEDVVFAEIETLNERGGKWQNKKF